MDKNRYRTTSLIRMAAMLAIMALSCMSARADIWIGGNVYGGGDRAKVNGNTTVDVIGGNIGDSIAPNTGNVFGGARMADVGGNALVNIDGENATDYIVINKVFGGNDISGVIEGNSDRLPDQVADNKDGVNETWNAFVHISSKDDDTTQPIYIGQLFGGGNGEYDYHNDTIYEAGTYGTDSPKMIAPAAAGFHYPDIAKTYVDIRGGSIVYAYGGGNQATVTDTTIIHVDNPSAVVNNIKDENGNELLTVNRFHAMGINTGLSYPSSGEFQIGRLFGGNNLAEMSIRPMWSLQSGKIRDLYSGGNRGAMTNSTGLLLNIPDSSTIVVDNVYGGCRMADVLPLLAGTLAGGDTVHSRPNDIQLYDKLGNLLYDFPPGYPARLLIDGGDINNIYGGNDVTGTVYGGNAIGLSTSIHGTLYGGGNGSYPYTDNPGLEGHDIYGDLYYNPLTILPGLAGESGYTGLQSAQALNLHRPNAEQISICLKGDEDKPTIIKDVYLGGNSASVSTEKDNPTVELRMSSYVYVDDLFLGNNGANMISINDDERDEMGNLTKRKGILNFMNQKMDDDTRYNTMDLTKTDEFAEYMNGAAMHLVPTITEYDYKDYTSYVGSLFCGGNVGSMNYPGTNVMDFNVPIVIFDKIVGGCNNANVPDSTGFNADYMGGLIGYKGSLHGTDVDELASYTEGDAIKDRLVMNLNDIKIQPMRWATDAENGDYLLDPNGNRYLVWNTNVMDSATFKFVNVSPDTIANDTLLRLLNGNIYGGCYSSGHVNGNVVINVNHDIIFKDEMFQQEGGEKNSGVILDEQSFDINAVALTVFGAGYGAETEIWGGTTVNHNKGYIMQAFGGGYEGVVGKKNGQGEYEYNPLYSTIVNLNGKKAVYSYDESADNLPEAEYLYGGGNMGDVSGDTRVYLGNGRIYDAFGGASDADILGHTEVYIGKQIRNDSIIYGFPFVRDIVYGGNDFDGTIWGQADFRDKVRKVTDEDPLDVMPMVYNPNSKEIPEVLYSSTYVEYIQGHVDTIFGGSYGSYDYKLYEGNRMPRLHNSFVNIRPRVTPTNMLHDTINAIFGAATGYPDNRDGDRVQEHSYVLVDIPDTLNNFLTTDIFGSGCYGGIGMGDTLLPKSADDADYADYASELVHVSAVIDLIRGKVGAAYGGSYNEGVTRRTVVNVPQGSKINIGSIFGGAYGNVTLSPCDVYEANVEYHSDKATLRYDPPRIIHRDNKETLLGFDQVEIDTVTLLDGEKLLGKIRDKGAIYGGNNYRRRTMYTKINLDVRLSQQSYKYGNTTGYVYGAGCGENTWAEYTEVNLLQGADVWEVYGGGQDGLVINATSIQKYINDFASVQGLDLTKPDDLEQWRVSWTLGGGLDGQGIEDAFLDANSVSYCTFYVNNIYNNLDNPLVTPRPDGTGHEGRYSTNVLINKGAYVGNYAYGGGLGHGSKDQSGNVYGTTYIALLGGQVKKDLYAAGSSGAVADYFGVGPEGPNGFTASTTAYIEGGTMRNVYGGGWEGNVGVDNETMGYIPGQTNVVIGIRNEDATDTPLDYYKGIPAIQRNAYAGGEGGSILGTANITVNNGYIGYVHLNANEGLGDKGQIVTQAGTAERYEMKIDDETYYDDKGVWQGKNNLVEYGNVFGSGYDDLSSVDISNVKLYGGMIRNSVFGGGEIAIVGRGKNTDGNISVTKAGQTHIYMYNGHVLQNVFGGGKGYNSLGYGGKNNLNTEGYVFGRTDVNIYGGEIGTEEGVAKNYGNVFGGGDRGFVYSAYEYTDPNDGKTKSALTEKRGTRYDGNLEGYYYDNNNSLTNDCSVLVEPWLQVTSTDSITHDGRKYGKNDYIPTSYLNTLPGKEGSIWPPAWNNVDAGSATGEGDDYEYNERGIIIHNAVFAGGNVSSGQANNANTSTVLGNATATINDVYYRDLITVGTGHTGGLYGEGNLTFVDGYRELNITNYGTDYYNIDPEITIETYKKMAPREQAYYELRYKCISPCSDKEGTVYRTETAESKASTITMDEMLILFIEDSVSITDNDNGQDIMLKDDEGNWYPNPTYWVENGLCSRYAGRIMNTIQRADFCGVFGSRMVMHGAQDRVPESADFTNYTINRVREVSLNKNQAHGNYFGIYSVVNYLGALTSDVDFHNAVRKTENKDSVTYKSSVTIDGSNTIDYGTATYSNWKQAHYKDNTRNNGQSHNQVALASGAYLELTSENSTGTSVYEKDWGPITGVVELDLINTTPGQGGGFVYAKNLHGKRSEVTPRQPHLISQNSGAVTNKKFTYAAAGSADTWEASGNFVHSTQVIIDDCYDIGGRYHGSDSVPAHYWFIKGLIYIYDQYITTFTGSPNSTSETVDIPLTITAASHSGMKLVEVKKNRYAYYANTGQTVKKLDPDQKLIINDVTYTLNDPIDYWTWSLLSAKERELFVEETYVNCMTVKVDGELYEAGTYVMSDKDFNTFRQSSHTYLDTRDSILLDRDKNPAGTDYVFRMSNSISHDRGYLLTYEVNNPGEWDKWYTPINDGAKITTAAYADLSNNEQAAYENGPTYKPITSGLYGQRQYKHGDIIPYSVDSIYQASWSRLTTEQQGNMPEQATFEPAYITTDVISTSSKVLQKGAKLAQAEYSATEWSSISGNVAPAYVCTSTIKITDTEYIVINELMTGADKDAYITRVDAMIAEAEAGGDNIKKQALMQTRRELEQFIVPAYYCTSDSTAMYGGDYYDHNKNYRALNAWSSMSAADRSNFTFNYDAFDLLIDSTFAGAAGQKYQYDGYGYASETDARQNPAGYSLLKPLDYTATFLGTYMDDHGNQKNTNATYSYSDGNGSHTFTVSVDQELNPEQYEAIPNEQRHYTRFTVTDANKDSKPDTLYIVNQAFINRDTPYYTGQVITAQEYNLLGEYQAKVDTIDGRRFSQSQIGDNYYYCREPYAIGKKGDIEYDDADYKPVTHAFDNDLQITNQGDTVPLGFVITENSYNQLVNKQLGFMIHGVSPKELSTLYVSRNSEIYDLSKERIITVIYQYDYEESNESGSSITPVSERHIVNIHLQFKSGIPTVGDITSPTTILPGTSITMKEPVVTPGAYELIGSGWELFEKTGDAESHTNGMEYTPTSDSLYWYQDGYYIAYYAKTYLGKTYSNYVPVSVANYHDIMEVMNDKDHHLYVDYNPDKLKRDSKIYINDYSRNDGNGLDVFKKLFDLSLLTSDDVDTDPLTGRITNDHTINNSLNGHTLMNPAVRGGNRLEFILRTDIDHSESGWEPIGYNKDVCFGGTLHGDGHTISGLDNTLFDKLCGNVYNLGVTGTFMGAGIAETGSGYIENCWIYTTTDPEGIVYAVLGNPTNEVDDWIQVVNCYYPDFLNYKTSESDDAHAHGMATPKPAESFYNGEVSFNLNGFYLNKRYYDNTGLSEGRQYYYLAPEGATTDTLAAYYPATPDARFGDVGYVERRYADGDFRYAEGTIPTWADQHEVILEEDSTAYVPFWPDDYLFFGQDLTYGYDNNRPHDALPTIYSTGNRVLRAPAYYGDSVMSSIYFNADAWLAAKSSDGTRNAYPGLTAIDLHGHNDLPGGYVIGQAGNKFYGPLLDTMAVTSIATPGQTRNLVVYAPTGNAGGKSVNGTTLSTLNAYFQEPAYNSYYSSQNRNVDEVTAEDINLIHGHLVSYALKAMNDHLLVDREDFNAPIAYSYIKSNGSTTGNRMWYQRKPDLYMESSNGGWETVSLPFTAELVSTQQKGEITHFYQGSAVGHEYWLREFSEVNDQDTILFRSLTAASTGSGKTAGNTFLWDYYYSHQMGDNAGRDANEDEYQLYYKTSRTYADYPYYAAGTPYLIGWPGNRYYEFDLSGAFKARNTAPQAPAQLEPQVITFASETGISIEVTDQEYTDGKMTAGNHSYVPTYQAKPVTDAYIMDANGTSFELKADTVTVPFRPYFTTSATGGSHAPLRATRAGTLHIGYTGQTDQLEETVVNRSLYIYPGSMSICVESTLDAPAQITVTNVAGKTLGRFTIQPGTRLTIPVNSRGVYIVNHQKIAVTR